VYRRFLADPQPCGRWVASGRKRARHDPRWRPFHGSLAATGQRQAMVILNALFAWLVEAGYLAGNPLSLSRRRARRASPRVTRFLERDLWQEVKVHVDSLPRETDRERERYWRAMAVHPALPGWSADHGSQRQHDGRLSADAMQTVTSDGGSKLTARETSSGWCQHRPR
jgi:hypothetical protein